MRLAFLLFFILISCTRERVGSLLVKANGEGQFEIYRIEAETPLQLVSEDIGELNKPQTLPVGRYLILADCSSQITVIREGITNELVAHRIDFELPNEFAPDDRLAIQCNRFDQVRFRQTLTNQKTLQVLSGKRELLIGMVPFATPADVENDTTPTSIKLQVGALWVKTTDDAISTSQYFVSPIEERLSLTISQSVGTKLYFLPGKYSIELNGTSKEVQINPLELVSITVGRFRVSTPKDAEIERAFQITGNPLAVEINDGHLLDFDEWYFALPGSITVKLVGTDLVEKAEVLESQDLEMQTRSVRVEIDCSPWEWTCLGSRKVYLYRKDDAYPFAVGATDVPLLFLQPDVWLGLEGSRDIRFQIPESPRSVVLKAGKLELIPDVTTKPGQVTDLVRVEAISSNTSGNTLDLSLEDPSVVPLIEGRYRLSNYVSSQNIDGARRKTEKIMQVSPGKTSTDRFPVILSEKRFQQFSARKASASGVSGRGGHLVIDGHRIVEVPVE
jgi:hypothetical protein